MSDEYALDAEARRALYKKLADNDYDASKLTERELNQLMGRITRLVMLSWKHVLATSPEAPRIALVNSADKVAFYYDGQIRIHMCGWLDSADMEAAQYYFNKMTNEQRRDLDRMFAQPYWDRINRKEGADGG